MHVVAVDVGNSATKYALGTTGSLEPAWTAARSWNVETSSIRLPFHEPCYWIVASVNAGKRDVLRQWAEEREMVCSWHDVTLSDIPLEVDLPCPKRVGMDRLLAATACTTWSGGRDCIVVDCGTALTIDLVRGGKTFCGGAIVAGPQAALQALTSLTDALPDLTTRQMAEPASAVGKSTEQAMLGGAYFAQLGAMMQIVGEIRSALSHEPIVVVSGGAMGLWKHRLPRDWIVVDNLVIAGILKLAPIILPAP